MEGESGEKQKYNSKKHSCKTCGKLFSKKNTLLIHERIHTGAKPYECDFCEKTFTQSNHLADHKRIHTGEKPFKCDLCKKTFSYSQGLALHKKVHAGVKPYACDICEKTFSYSHALAQHKNVHTGEKPYACEICEKTFSQSGSLSYHKRIHTGEKPFSCEICQKSFSKSSNLSLHNKSAYHLKRKEIMNRYSFDKVNNFVDCCEVIKEEDFNEEIKEDKSVDNPLPRNYSTESGVKQEVNEQVKYSDEGQGVEDSNLDTDHLVDCTQYLQVEMNLTK